MSKLSRLDPSSLSTNPRCTLSSWSRYRKIVLSAYHAFPTPYLFTPTSCSPAFFTTRCRDAIRGCLAFEFEPDLTSSLLSWWGKTILREEGEKVAFRPAERQPAPVQGNEPQSKFTFKQLRPDEFGSFLLLLSRGLLEGPITVLEPAGLNIPLEVYNCEVIHTDDGKLIIL